MVDNVTFQDSDPSTPPNNTVVAADDIGGIKYQFVKVGWGAHGVANYASAATPLPVDGSGVTQPVSGTLTASQGGAPWSVSQSGTWNIGTLTTVTTVSTVTAVTAITNALPAGTNTIGKTFAAAQTTKALTNANVSISSSGENTVVSGTAAQTIRAFAGSLTAAAAVTMTVKDAAGGTTLATIPLSAGGVFAFDTISSGEPLWVTASAGAFIISLDSAVAVKGFVQYTKS